MAKADKIKHELPGCRRQSKYQGLGLDLILISITTHLYLSVNATPPLCCLDEQLQSMMHLHKI